MVRRRLLPPRPNSYIGRTPKETRMTKMTAAQAAVLVMEKEG